MSEAILHYRGRLSLAESPDFEPDVAPLTSHQWRHWLLEQTGMMGDAYHMPTMLRCDGPLDLGLVHGAVAMLRRRHAVLRVSYPVVGGRPLQLLGRDGDIVVPCIDLSRIVRPVDSPLPDRDSEIWRIMQRVSAAPFDLHNGPLFRAAVFRLSRDLHYLLLNFHHSICDAWSLGIIARDFLRFYGAPANMAAAAPEEALSYLQFARLAKQADPHELDFWRDALDGARIYLPVGADGIAEASGSGLVRSVVAGDEFAAIQEVCRGHAITLFMYLMTAFHLVLRAVSGRRDQLTGTVVAGRTNYALRDTVGCFVNYLPLRIVSPRSGSLDELFGGVRSAILRFLAHQNCEFEEIVGVAPVRGGNPRNPLFNVGLVLQNMMAAVIDGETAPGGTVFTAVSAPPIEPTLDVRLSALETPGGLELCWEYDRRLIGENRMRAIGLAFDLMLQRLRKPGVTIEESLSDLRADFSPAAGFDLRIASSGGIEPLARTIEQISALCGLDVDISILPDRRLDNVGASGGGLTVLVLRPSDWVRATADAAAHLLASLQALEGEGLVICVDEAIQDDRTVEWLTGLRAIVHGIPGFEWRKVEMPQQELALLEPARLQYGPLFVTAAAVAVTRRIFEILMRANPYKVLVMDCDGTLWGGACGEVGHEGVLIDASWRDVQSFAVEQYRKGLLVCLCSRNNAEDVEAVFRTRSEMILGLDMLAARRISWRSKSAMIAELAAELKLGLDSFIFVDDDPVQIAEVKRNCPAVTTIHLPAGHPPGEVLRHHWAFSGGTAAEAERRQQYYRHEATRTVARASQRSFAAFIEFLQLSVRHFPCGATDRDRLFELLMRTNQFNLTGARPDRAELERRMAAAELEVCLTSVSDRFADYGTVGAILYGRDRGTIRIENLVLSCRALGRGVELAILKHLACGAGDAPIAIRYSATGRNAPALAFMAALAGGTITPHGELMLKASDIMTVPLEALPDGVHLGDASRELPAGLWRPDDLTMTALAACGDDPAKVMAWLQGIEASPEAAVKGRGELERILLPIWRRALKRPDDPGHRTFFESGGASFAVLQLLTDIRMRFGIAIPLMKFYEDPRFSALVREISAVWEAPDFDRNVPTASPVLPPLPSQHGFWSLHHRLPDTSVLHLPLRLRIDTTEAAGGIFTTVERIFARHGALWMGLVVDEGDLRQVPFFPAIGICDISAMAHGHEAAADALWREVISKPFALGTESTVRALIVLTPAGCEVQVSLHRVSCDAESVRILRHELLQLLSSDMPLATLPRAPDYQESCLRLTQRAIAPDIDGRILELAQCNFEVSLPRLERTTGPHGIDGTKFRLGIGKAARLAQLAHARCVKLDVVLFAVMSLLIHRYGGDTDLAVAMTIDIREQPGSVGCFSNSVLLRLPIRPGSTFVDLLGDVADAFAAATPDRFLPFENVVDLVRGGENQTGSSSPQLAFSYRAMEGEWDASPDLVGGHFDRRGMAGLAFLFYETPEGLDCAIEFDRCRYQSALARQLALHYQALVDAVTSAPQTGVSTMPLLTATERARVERWNNTATFFSGPRVLTEMVLRQFRRQPGAPAIMASDGTCSYAELAASASAWAGRVSGFDPPPNWRGAIMVSSGQVWIGAALGIMLAGGAVVLLDPECPAQSIGSALAGVRLALLCTDRDITLDQTMTVRLVPSAPRSAPAIHLAPADPDRECYVAMLGERAIAIRHSSIANTIYDINTRFRIGAADRILVLSGFSTDRAIYDVFGTLAAGGAVVVPTMAERKSLAALQRLMLTTGVTVLNSPVSWIAEYCTFLDRASAAPPATLRIVLLSNEEIDDTLVEMMQRLLPGVAVVALSGAVEASIWSLAQPLDAVAPGAGALPLGRPLANQTALVLDQTGEICPPFACGELHIGGEGLAAGYLKDEELTRARFVRDVRTGERLYRTGRRAMYSEDGTIVRCPAPLAS